MSENRWTNNELGLDWLKTVFEPNTGGSHFQGEYRLLLVDGHDSHVSTEFIKYVQSKKIKCLCLPPHITHRLQPLDVGVFSPLAHSYKKYLESLTRFTMYNINKVDFLTIVQKARKEGISSKNIESAWRATGLIPYNPATVIKNLKPKRKQAPVTALVTTPERQSSILPFQTPANMAQVSHIDELISQFRHQTLDTPKLELLSKLVRGAKLAMADWVVLNTTNAELHEANVRKKKRVNRGGKQYDGQGARHLGLEKVEQRRQYAIDKQQELEARQIAKKLNVRRQSWLRHVKSYCGWGQT